jgi:hypothetical protein
MEWKPKVRLLAALLAEHESREAVSAPPLKWSRHAALAYRCGRNTLGIENAMQVVVNPENKLLYVGVFRLRHALDTAGAEYEGELTLFCFSGVVASSFIHSVSSTSMGWGSVSCNVISFFFVPAVFRLGVGRLVEALTSTGMYLVPRETFRGTHSTTFGLFRETTDAFML